MPAESLIASVSALTDEPGRLLEIVALSLKVSGAATLCAALIGLPVGAVVALSRGAWRQPVLVVLNALMGLPPVVVGLVVYLLLSRSGPLGVLGWLFTPTGMIFAQTLLIAPIIAALARQTIEDAHLEYRDWFDSMGLSTTARARTLLMETRFSLLVVLLAGFGRAIAEVGAVMIVGGNIAGATRVMTTSIALETSKGDLPIAIALGVVLLAVVLVINGLAQWLKFWRERRYG